MESYPVLLVRAPLTATPLLHLYPDRLAFGPMRISFRGLRPLYCGRPIELCGSEGSGLFRFAVHDDRQSLAITAEASPNAG